MTDIAPTTETFWVENLASDVSMFRNTPGRGALQFRLEPSGYVGSVMEVDRRLLFDPYIRRAIARKKLRELTEQEAYARQADLEIREDGVGATEPLMKSLDSAENLGRYAKPDLPDEAESRPAISATEIWSRGGTAATRPAPPAPKTAQRSAIDDGPILDSTSVLTPRVKQGEWETQTG